MNIPNAISIARIIIIPVFIFFFFSGLPNGVTIAAILLIISGVSDYADGFIAKKFNMVTDIGKLLDPLADKITQIAVVVCLSIGEIVPLWVFIVVLSKELFMLAGSFVILKWYSYVVFANWYGKVTTALFYFAIVFIMLFNNSISYSVKMGIIIVILVLNLFSLAMYFVQVLLKVRQQRRIERETGQR